MKVYVLMDNRKTEGSDFETEHGFSLWIDLGGRGILYDTGVSAKTFDNASWLGIDIRNAECAVISHGHFDHAGGLRHFLEHNTAAPVYLHPLAWGRHLSNTTGTLRYIGVDNALASGFAGRFVHVERSFDEGDFAFIVPSSECRFQRPSGNRVLFSEEDGNAVPDLFRHEIIFAVRERGSLVVFSGCSHRGIENIMADVAERFPGVPVRAVFGGFHMSSPATGKLTEEEQSVRGTAERLLSYGGCMYYTGHCTGVDAYTLMKERMGERISLLAAGQALDI